jgi:hypothetical protein
LIRLLQAAKIRGLPAEHQERDMGNGGRRALRRVTWAWGAVAMAGCGAPDGEDGGAGAGPSTGVCEPAAAPAVRDDWNATVGARMAASAFAVHEDSQLFRAENRAIEYGISWDSEGLRLSVRAGDSAPASDLRLRLALEDSAPGGLLPALGACRADGALDIHGDCLRRVEIPHRGGKSLEWWENRPEGLEFGFELAEPPPASAPSPESVASSVVELPLSVSGATASVEPGGAVAWLRPPAGAAVQMASLAVVDASGEPLPSWFEPRPDGIAIRFDAASARWPVSVDPLLTTPSFTVTGPAPGSYFGIASQSLGDVNGDGYDDAAISAPGYVNATGRVGFVQVYMGAPTGLSTTPVVTIEPPVADGSGTFGGAAASAGDVNGDGYSDLSVGCVSCDVGGPDTGAAWVWHGSASGLGSTPDWVGSGANGYDMYGTVAAAGDVNGDGFSDLAVGAQHYANGTSWEGAAYVYLGSNSGLATTAAWLREGNALEVLFGEALAAVGDTNRDGYGDLLVGAGGYAADVNIPGSAYLYLGSAVGLSTTPSWTGTGPQNDSRYGGELCGVGDVNGDGYTDFAVGANTYTGSYTDEGAAFLYLGQPDGMPLDSGWRPVGGAYGVIFGTSIAALGDVNGDGYSDAAVGSPFYDGSAGNEGRAQIFLGDAAGFTDSPQFTVYGPTGGSWLGYGGYSLGGGDFDGDGYGELIGGMPSYPVDGDYYTGRAQVWEGGVAGISEFEGWSAQASGPRSHRPAMSTAMASMSSSWARRSCPLRSRTAVPPGSSPDRRAAPPLRPRGPPTATAPAHGTGPAWPARATWTATAMPTSWSALPATAAAIRATPVSTSVRRAACGRVPRSSSRSKPATSSASRWPPPATSTGTATRTFSSARRPATSRPTTAAAPSSTAAAPAEFPLLLRGLTRRAKGAPSSATRSLRPATSTATDSPTSSSAPPNTATARPAKAPHSSSWARHPASRRRRIARWSPTRPRLPSGSPWPRLGTSTETPVPT